MVNERGNTLPVGFLFADDLMSGKLRYEFLFPARLGDDGVFDHCQGRNHFSSRPR